MAGAAAIERAFEFSSQDLDRGVGNTEITSHDVEGGTVDNLASIVIS